MNKVHDWEEVEGGFRVLVRYLDGAPAAEFNVISLDFRSNDRFGEYRFYDPEGWLKAAGQYYCCGSVDSITNHYNSNNARIRTHLVA